MAAAKFQWQVMSTVQLFQLQCILLSAVAFFYNFHFHFNACVASAQLEGHAAQIPIEADITTFIGGQCAAQ